MWEKRAILARKSAQLRTLVEPDMDLVSRPMTRVAIDALRVGKAAFKRDTKKLGRPSGLPICRSSPRLASNSGASAKFPILRTCVESRLSFD